MRLIRTAPVLLLAAWALAPSHALAAGPPDIEVHRADASLVDIPDGGSFAMGTTTTGVPFEQYFAVGNVEGADDLHITSVTAPAGFTIVQNLPGTIHGGASWGIRLRCNAASAGSYSGNLVIVSDDPDESPYEIALSCTVTDAGGSPTIRLALADGTPVNDGGEMTLATGASKVVRIYNDQGGDAPLLLSAPVIAPAGPAVQGYVVDDVVAADGMSQYFVIRCATANSSGTPILGDYSVSIASNAPGASNPYTFTLHCVTAPPATTTTVAGAPQPTASTGAVASGGGTLPATGAASGRLVAVGALLVALGLAVRWPGRRDRYADVTR